MNKKLKKLIDYLSETIEYFLQKIQNVNEDLYFANRDIRYILDKSINDIILCIVDICEEILKINKSFISEVLAKLLLLPPFSKGD